MSASILSGEPTCMLSHPTALCGPSYVPRTPCGVCSSMGSLTGQTHTRGPAQAAAGHAGVWREGQTQAPPPPPTAAAIAGCTTSPQATAGGWRSQPLCTLDLKERAACVQDEEVSIWERNAPLNAALRSFFPVFAQLWGLLRYRRPRRVRISFDIFNCYCFVVIGGVHHEPSHVAERGTAGPWIGSP